MKAPVKILVVDDDEDDFYIIREYISKINGQEFVVDWCSKYSDAIKKICDAEHHLYFIDYRLNAKTGLELIQQAIVNNCEEPFILLTGNGNHSIDMKAMESGAMDYLVKGELSTEKMERCIRYSLERSSSLKALRVSERKFRSIFERSRDTMFTADPTLLFTEVNDASSLLLGYSRRELLSLSLYSLFANKKDIQLIQEQLMNAGGVADREIELFTKSAERKYAILTLSKETDIHGITYIQGIIHDVTALKRSEKSTLMIEKLNATGRLVRMMAHEVRNPLNNILLSADQLEIHEENDESVICLDIIKRNSRRIENIIAELLNSSRPTQVAVEKLSLQSILDESIEAATDRITLKHILLKRDYLDEPAWIMADINKLKIAFLNIIINAVEAVTENKGELLISLKKEEGQYVVAIEDNGCGISEENLSHLFEPYFTSKQNGMGLGLASALNILRSHNASFDVQSTVDNGTVFKLFFNAAGG